MKIFKKQLKTMIQTHLSKYNNVLSTINNQTQYILE